VTAVLREPPTQAPRPRADLEVHEREEDGDQVFVVKDAALGAYHRLGPGAFAVLDTLEALDGQAALSALPAALRERHGAELAPDELAQLLTQLGRMQLFEVTEADARARGEPAAVCAALTRLDPSSDEHAALQARLLRKWQPRLSLRLRLRRVRWHLFDPGRLLRRLEPLGRVLFTTRAAVVAAGLAVVALALTLEHQARLGAELAALAERPLCFALVALAVTFVHELGHGLACQLYGGQVRDLGVMLLYLVLPAAYCDISDAHLVDSRRRRAVIAMAGCYVNLWLWIAATLAWRCFEPDLLVTRVALGIIATTALSLFVNLNPLLPLDGYYALEELLGVNNLRSRSRKGARGVYRIYRWLAGGYLWIFVPLALHRAFAFLVPRFRLLGLLGFAALASVMIAPYAPRVLAWARGQ
jgi:putative peptide zinc metalloprotease protein